MLLEQLFCLLPFHRHVLVSLHLLVLENGQLLFQLANAGRLIGRLHHGPRAVLEFAHLLFQGIDLDALLLTFLYDFICLLLHLFDVELQLLLEANVLADVRLQLDEQLLVALSLFGQSPINIDPVHRSARIGRRPMSKLRRAVIISMQRGQRALITHELILDLLEQSSLPGLLLLFIVR